MAVTAWDLSDVYRPGLVHDPVPCFHAPGWLPAAREILDSLSGGQIALAGDVPVICHRAGSHAGVLQLLRDVGYRAPTRLLQYETQSEYAGILRGLESDGARLAVAHVHAENALDANAYWIPRDLLCRLNNKGELGRIALRESLPRRECVDAAEFAARPAPDGALPLAVKVASPLSSGAGFGVKLCRTPEDWACAQRDFRSSPRIVIEEWLEIRTIHCVQFIVHPESVPRFIGSAEQVANDDGGYAGNWITARERGPDAAVSIARSAAQSATEMGYLGICGFDIVVCADESMRIIDANFRFNGSSLPLSLRPWMRDRGADLARSGFWSHDGPFVRLAEVVRAANRRGDFMPFSLWDGGHSPSRVSGIVVGANREEIAARIDRLQSEGLG